LQAVYRQRKNALFRRAAELSSVCGCEVAVVVFGPAGELSQFSSADMESVLRKYSRACTDVHETHTGAAPQKRRLERAPSKGHPSKKRANAAGALHRLGNIPSGAVEAPAEDADAPTLSPRSTGAYEHIDREFEKLIEGRARRAQQQTGSTASPTGEATSGAAPAPAAAAAPGGAEAEAEAPAAGSGDADGDGTTSQGEGAAAALPTATSGPTSAFDFLAAALAGNNTAGAPQAVAVGGAAAAGTSAPATNTPPGPGPAALGSGAAAGAVPVGTPAVVPTPMASNIDDTTSGPEAAQNAGAASDGAATDPGNVFLS
jgi:hypothetical protein